METFAKVNAKGQITIPPEVCEALGLKDGDDVFIRVNRERALIGRIPNLLELAGSVEVPVEKRGTPWEEVLRETHRELAARQR